MNQRRITEPKQGASPSEFSLILRRVCDAISTVQVAAFIDMEGECIDYYSSLDPYQAKLIAAQIVPLLDAMAASARKLGFGELYLLEIDAGDSVVWTRRINDDYLLAVVAGLEEDGERMGRVLVHAAREFRTDAGVAPARWEPQADVMRVETREARGWPYAPTAFTDAGQRFPISEVLGSWIETGELRSKGNVCFRVRTDQGMEVTLVHDPDLDQWTSRL